MSSRSVLAPVGLWPVWLAVHGLGCATAGGGTETHRLGQTDTEPLAVTRAAQDTVRTAVAQVRSKDRSTFGTAFLVSDAGHLVTAEHVVGNADIVELRFDDEDPSDGWHTVRVLEKDPGQDLALLELTEPSQHGSRPTVPVNVPRGDRAQATRERRLSLDDREVLSSTGEVKPAP